MDMSLTRRSLLATSLMLPFTSRGMAGDWFSIEAEARGQTVYFNAWAGSAAINDYIAWAGSELQVRYGITLVHVKIADAAEVVRRVRDEAAAKAEGAVDLVWINGENFVAMKKAALLFGPFAETLPNFRFVDTQGKPTTRIDFAEPVEGYESPWGMAQLTFFGDGTKIAAPPRDIAGLVELARAHPGRVSYPAPPDFHGTTFVKQVLAETIGTRELLRREISETDFDGAAKPMWALLDSLHPLMWRKGHQFPQTQAELRQMYADGELIMALTFNPSEPANLIAEGQISASTIAWQHAGGTIGNTHFVAIPVNAKAKAAAQVTANFLLSPEAQARKADPKVWGDPTVLRSGSFPAPEGAGGGIKYPGPAMPEPHASWVPIIEAKWLLRYGL